MSNPCWVGRWLVHAHTVPGQKKIRTLKVEVLLRSHADPYIIASHLTRGLLIFHREVVQTIQF